MDMTELLYAVAGCITHANGYHITIILFKDNDLFDWHYN